MNPIDTPAAEAVVEVEVNGRSVAHTVPVRRLLSDFLRDDLELVGTLPATASN